MGMHVARNATSFILFSTAFIVILIGSLLSAWYNDNNGNSFGFDDLNNQLNDFASQFQSQLSPAQESLSSGMKGCAFTAVALTAVCVLLSFIIMCADCCCHVNKYLAVIPRVNISIATLAGILAEAACILLLVKITGSLKNITGLKLSYMPGASFYLVGAGGLLLMITGCVNCRIRYDTRVEVMETQVVVAQQSQMQMQSQMTSFGGMTMSQGMAMNNWNGPQYNAHF